MKKVKAVELTDHDALFAKLTLEIDSLREMIRGGCR